MNRYLADTFAPVHQETTAFDLEVTGELPGHLDGRYLRIGPNPMADPGPSYHWFVGEGMTHGVRLRDGHAEWYRNRLVAPADGFGANTNVVQHAGRTLALVEGGAPQWELGPELESLGTCDLDGTLPGRGGWTAHPHEDPDTGELHAVSYDWSRGNRLTYTVVGVDGRVRRALDVEVHGSPMVHDFALTTSYVVLYDLPVTFDIDAAIAGMSRASRVFSWLALRRIIGRDPLPDAVIARVARGAGSAGPTSLPYSWDPDYPARIGLLPRDAVSGDEARWFEIDPCYVFHTLNAYEEPGLDGAAGEVVVDVVRHPSMFRTDLTGPAEGAASLTRLTIDVAAGKVREHRFDEHHQEFPRYDERLTGRRHRYGWSVGFDGPVPGDRVLKHDVHTGTTLRRSLGEGRVAGEFCFVPASASAREDEGVLMGYVHDRATDRSDLVVLDAETLDDVAAVHLPVRVPAGFHGNWIEQPGATKEPPAWASEG